ncbi:MULTISPECIES: beta-propeller fold lactonase family protein [unclassified Nocardia]|uniref:lactonase family protein n=1 Tax=unclassified Nocardia TaxID=2637762 RepID=UPI001CE44855|nr:MULTISPECIES: beta-propeller fold lactonase family protein [unclassified Nocardia]
MIVYVSNAESREISVLRLTATGELIPLSATDVGGKVMPLAVAPDRRYLYAGLRSEPYEVVVLAIAAASGELRVVSRNPLPDNMAYLATDRSGRYLLGASYTGDRIAVCPIDGAAVGAAVAVTATPPHAHSIVADPSNHHLLVGALGGDVILRYRFAEGRIHDEPTATPTKSGAGPRHIVFHPNGRAVFVSNELDGTVNGYSFDAGVLTETASASVLPPGHASAWTSDLHITPDGRYLYVADRNSSTLAGFRVDRATGGLEPIGYTPTETRPRGFAIDPGGRYLVAAGQLSRQVTSYAIGGDGALRAVGRCRVGDDPNWVEIVDPAS